MSSVYDRFKPTALKDIKERQNEVSNLTNEYENSTDQLFKRKRIKEDGVYDIRVYPAHEGIHNTSIEPKVVYFVPSKRKAKDQQGNFIKDNKGNEVLEDSVRAVFDAKVHGESQYDLVDSYITLVKKQADVLYEKNEAGKKEYLSPIIGNQFTGGDLKGLNANRSYVFYGDLLEKKGDEIIETFHEFEVSKAIQKGINNVAAIENSMDPLGTDGCFTDPQDGRPVRIVVDKMAGKKNSADYYKVSIVSETEKMNVGGRMQNVMKSYPIAEEKLIWFDEKVPSLSEYRKTFKRIDLDLQLKGLELFDNKFKFNILNSEEFKEIFNYLDKKFPVEEKESDNEDSQSQSNSSSSEDELDLMELAELKQYIKENKLGITVLPSFSAQNVREMIRSILSGDVDDDNNDANQSENQYDDDEQPTQATSSYKERIEKLKNSTK